MWPALLLVVLSQSPAYPSDAPRPTCLSQYGQTVCGYGCVANYGQVKCAQTPRGVCKAEYGEVTCWDPPGAAQGGGFRGGPPPTRPGTCRSAYGRTECGFDCVANYGQLKCAQTAQGACKAEYGQVVCWDPPEAWPGAPKAECLSNYGVTVCGYGCVANYGQVRCAQSPQGVCQAASGEIRCWEPGQGQGGHRRHHRD